MPGDLTWWILACDVGLIGASFARIAWERSLKAGIDRAFGRQLEDHGVDATIVGGSDRNVVIGRAEHLVFWSATSKGFTLDLGGRPMRVPEGVPVVYRHRAPKVVDKQLTIRGGTQLRAIVVNQDVGGDGGAFRGADVLSLDARITLVPLEVAQRDRMESDRVSVPVAAVCLALPFATLATVFAGLAIAFVMLGDHALDNLLIRRLCRLQR
jgi:hypothetical protein